MAISTKWTATYIGLGMGIIYLIKFILGKKLDLKLLGWSILAFIIVPLSIYILSYIPIIKNPNHEVTYTYQYQDPNDKLAYFDDSSIYSQTTENNTTTVTYKVKITDIKSFIEYQKIMYTYHSRLTDSHTYSSKWYEWPIIKRHNSLHGKSSNLVCRYFNNYSNNNIWNTKKRKRIVNININDFSNMVTIFFYPVEPCLYITIL